MEFKNVLSLHDYVQQNKLYEKESFLGVAFYV